MKLFFKRLTMFAVIFGFALAFVACTEETTATTTEQQTTMQETTTVEETTAVDLLVAVPNMIIIDSSDQITGDFLLPGTVQGVTITYTSSDTDVIVISDTVDDDGFYTAVVTTPSIPEGGVNTSVTITGTMTLGTETATFTKGVRVLAQNLRVVDDIADLLATCSLNDVTEITGTVYATFSGGFFIYDASGTLGVYDSSVDVAVGDEVTLKGALGSYYTLYQLTNIATYTINSSGNAITLSPMVLGNGAYIAQADSSNRALHGTVFTVTALLEEQTNGTYTNMFLVDVDGNNIAQIYHYGNEDALAVLNDNFLDKVITFDVVYYTDHGDVIYVVFDGAIGDVTVSSTNEEIAAFYANALEIDAEIAKNTSVDLPTTVGTLGTVTWALGTGETNVTLVDETATFGEVSADTTATLVATVTVDVDGTDVVLTRSFDVTILNISEADLVADDKADLTLDTLAVDELDAMDLPTMGDAGSTITWAVTTGEAFIVDGEEVVFDYTGAAQTVTLTATITNGDADDTKVFTVAVSAITVSTIATVLAATDGDFAVKGNVYYTTQNGYFVEDTTGKLFIYNYTTPSVSVGDEVVVKGEWAAYHGATQLSYVVTSSAITEDNAVTQTATVYDPETTTLVPGSSYTLTGTLRYGPVVEDGYDNLYIEDADGDPCVMFYYKTDADSYYLLKDLVGTDVTIDAVYYNMDAIEMFVWLGTDTDVTLNGLTDLETVDAALSVLYIPGTVTEDATLDLPATLFGVSLTYVSDDLDYITHAGVVTTVADMQATVTITVTATLNDATKDEEFEVQVGDLPVSEISDIYDSTKFSNGDMIKVQGILTADIKDSGYTLQDSTGAIFLYVPSDFRDAFAELTIGCEMEIVGKLDNWNTGQNVLGWFTYEVLDETPSLPESVDISDIDFTPEGFLAYQSQLVTLTFFRLDEVVTASSGDSFNMTFISVLDDTKTIAVRVDYRASGYADLYAKLIAYTTSDIITVEGGVINWYGGTAQLALSYASQITSAAEYDVLLLDIGDALGDTTVALEVEQGSTVDVPLMGTYGTEFTYDFEELTDAGATFNAITGELVLPVATEDIDYTVPVLVEFGMTKVRINLTVTVFFMDEADQLAADVEDVEVALTAIEYDEVELDTVMGYGSVVTWAVTSGDATLNTAGDMVTYNATGVEQTVVLTATLTYTKADATTITATKEFSVVVTPYVPELFISEVLDWNGGTNKAIELYNPSDVAIVLDGVYTIRINSNANTTWGGNITLTGTIQPGETFVIVNASEQSLIDLADMTSSSVSFNGDDAIGLFKSDILVDLFGIFGEDPGTAWIVGTGDTHDSSIQRASTVVKPAILWDVNEWVYFDDTEHTLGTYTSATE